MPRIPKQPLLVLGASARAAAFSALRAGFAVQAGDLFADVDLARRCTAWKVAGYPEGLAALAQRAAPGAWLYTGGLENWPALVDRIAAVRPLWGNPGAVLRRVRDPQTLTLALAGCAARYPDWRPHGTGLPRDGSWLRKGLRSAGGLQVQAWDAACRARGEEPGWYFQRRVEGQSCAGLFVAAGSRAVLLGVTEQFVGAAWTGARGFRYAGSRGPLELPARLVRAWEEVGDRLAERFALVGLFGVDAVATGDALWMIEVNPRYPASAEVLERACRFSAIELHVRACREGQLAAPLRSGHRQAGKAVVFARQEVAITPQVAEALQHASQGDWPAVADLPAAGSLIGKGQPVMTVLVAGPTLSSREREAAEQPGEGGAVTFKLQEEVARWEQLLYATP